MEFKVFLAWLVSQAGAGYVTYVVMDYFPALVALPSKKKRLVSAAISAGIAIAAYVAQILMQFETAPTDWRAWFSKLFMVATGAFSLATLIHTRDLKDKEEAGVTVEPIGTG